VRLRRVRLRDEDEVSVAVQNGDRWIPIVDALARHRAEPGTEDLLGIFHTEIPTAVALMGVTRVEEIRETSSSTDGVASDPSSSSLFAGIPPTPVQR